jgi:polyisoprenoid-binding protein YceI
LHYAIDPVDAAEGDSRYLIDAKTSRFTLRAFATGLLSAFAHSPVIAIPDFSGELVFDPDAAHESSLRIVAQAASLQVTGEVAEKDREEMNRRMRGEVLESDRFPEILYECAKVSVSDTGGGQYAAVLNGELSLHGVTRAQPISAQVAIGGDGLRATGEFFVRLSDYEISPVSAAGGTIKLKDEVKFSFDLRARKQG